MEQRVIVDYFVCSWKLQEPSSPAFLFRLMGYFLDPDLPFSSQARYLDGFEYIRSYYGQPFCLYNQGIKIHFGGELVIFDCSGKGCRTLENQFDWDWEIFFKALRYDITYMSGSRDPPVAHISRLDIACDVLDSEKFTLPRIYDYVRRGMYVCKSQRYTYFIGTHENMIVFGSSSSDRRLRIYDKALEQGTPDKKWVRAEFQLRNDPALSFVLNFLNGETIPNTYYGVMHDYLRILKKPPDGSHYDRLDLAVFWQTFLGEIRKLRQVYLPKPVRSIEDFNSYVETNLLSTLRTYSKIHGGNIDDLMLLASDAKLNQSQLDIIEQYENENKDEDQFEIPEIYESEKDE